MAPPPPDARRSARVDFLGVGFDPLDLDGAVAWLRERRVDDPFAYVATPNVDHLVRANREPDLYDPLYRDAALCLCDSRVVVRLARFHGVELALAPGSDLTRLLFETVAQGGDRVRVVGSDADAVRRLGERYPHVVLEHCPAPMGLRRDPDALAATAARAAAPGARFVLLAVGAPQQEMVARAAAALPGAEGTALCIGASIDFLTGGQRRAPRAVQRMGMEWAWRLLSDPRRLAKRYLVDGPAVFPMARRWARGRRAGGHDGRVQ